MKAIIAHVGDFGESEAALREAIVNVPLNPSDKNLMPIVIVRVGSPPAIWVMVTEEPASRSSEEVARDYKIRLEGWFLAHKAKNIQPPK